MTQHVDLRQILTSRTAWAMFHLFNRVDQGDDPNSPWYAYSVTDPLKIEWVDWTTLRFTREKRNAGDVRPDAIVELTNIQLASTEGLVEGPTIVVSSDVKERAVSKINIARNTSYNETVSHTFSKLTTLREAAEVGAKIGFEATVGYQPPNTTGGVTGGVKFSAEISAKYSRNWGSDTTDSNTVSRNVHIDGPWRGRYIAERSVAKLQRTMSVPSNFEFQINVYEGTNKIYSWDSYALLLATLKGQAPDSVDAAKSFVYNSANPNRSGPISLSELHAMNAYLLPPITWIVTWDDVNYQTIDLVEDVPGTTSESIIEAN